MIQTVFYCWQSDSPQNTNQYLIGEALREAVSQVNDKQPITLSMDQASEEITGLVNIPDHIRKKLERCAIFVADLTIVAKTEHKGKPLTNSNVMLELGYTLAMMRRRSIDPPPVILVMNTCKGPPDDLPFDLGWNPVIHYKLEHDASEATRQQQRTRLVRQLIEMITSIIDGGQLFAGLSPEAFTIARFLNTDHKGGIASSTSYTDKDLADALPLSPEAIDLGTAELREKGFATELPISGIKDGYPLYPTASLFVAFDGWFQDWAPEDDARTILNGIERKEQGTQITAQELEERHGWDLRRLEPAMAWLIQNLLAEDSGEIEAPCQYPHFTLTHRAQLFLNNRFDPYFLKRRG